MFVVGLILMSTLASASTGDFLRLGKSRVLYVDQMLSFGNAEAFCKDRDSQLIEFWSDTEWKEVKHSLLIFSNYSNFMPHIVQGMVDTDWYERHSNMDRVDRQTR